MPDSESKFDLWLIVKSLSTLILVVVLAIKVYSTPIDLTVDFPTLLSLLLALFAVALSALFYFKATETSNTFYDNTYKFTRDIAQLLAKMESGFGERLRHLDEGYSSMRNYLQDGAKGVAGREIGETKKKLEDEKQEVHRAIEERNQIVRDLLERSNLQAEEKQRISEELKRKEDELAELQQNVGRLNRRLMMERVRKQRGMDPTLPSNQGLHRFTRRHVVDKIGGEGLSRISSGEIRASFAELMPELPQGYVDDLESMGYFESELTPLGISYLRRIARGESS